MNKNLALTLTAATLFIVIGAMAIWWFNGGNIDSVKPYVDPYNRDARKSVKNNLTI